MKDNHAKQIHLFAQYLRVSNYSKSTIEQYVSVVKSFLSQADEPPKRISSDEIVSYISNLKSSSAMRQARGALLHFYTHVIGQPNKFKRIPYPKKEKRLPVIQSRGQIEKKLSSIQNLKHKAILTLVYKSGIRNSELRGLLLSDVNGKDCRIHIRGKGAKDRVVPVSKEVIALLREYFLSYVPTKYLFEGWNGRYSASSLGKICLKYMGTNPHNLRHSNATHLIEARVPVPEVAGRLGHSSVKTTQVYTHIASDRSNVTL